jgi:hypothetical protein
MGYFDGMENQIEKEIYYKKFISAFISLVEDHLGHENEQEEKEYGAKVPPAMPPSTSNCRP